MLTRTTTTCTYTLLSYLIPSICSSHFSSDLCEIQDLILQPFMGSCLLFSPVRMIIITNRPNTNSERCNDMFWETRSREKDRHQLKTVRNDVKSLTTLQHIGWVIPDLTSSHFRSAQSLRNWLAPVRLPSPPIQTILLMECWMRFAAALSRPSRCSKSAHLALPMIVPP